MYVGMCMFVHVYVCIGVCMWIYVCVDKCICKVIYNFVKGQLVTWKKVNVGDWGLRFKTHLGNLLSKTW